MSPFLCFFFFFFFFRFKDLWCRLRLRFERFWGKFFCVSFGFFQTVSFGLWELIMLAAVQKGDSKELAELMRQDPGFKVNIDQEASGWTLLHYACRESSCSAVIPLLLAHPGIDVNLKAKNGHSPFFYASALEGRLRRLSCVTSCPPLCPFFRLQDWR